VSIEPVYQQGVPAPMAVRARPSVACATRKGQAGYVVREMRKSPETQSMEGANSRRQDELNQLSGRGLSADRMNRCNFLQQPGVGKVWRASGELRHCALTR
jgi:hypothetical protein